MAQCTKITVWEMHELKRFTSRKHGGRTPRRIKEKEKKWSRQEKEKEIKRKIVKVEETSENEKKKKHAYTKECSNGSQYAYTRCSSLRVCACVRVCVQERAPRVTLSGDFDSPCRVRRFSSLSVDAHNWRTTSGVRQGAVLSPPLFSVAA